MVGSYTNVIDLFHKSKLYENSVQLTAMIKLFENTGKLICDYKYKPENINGNIISNLLYGKLEKIMYAVENASLLFFGCERFVVPRIKV